MSVSILREPLRDYLATNMPDTCWHAASQCITGDLIKNGYSEGEFIRWYLYDDHIALKNSKGKQNLRIYYYRHDFLDRVLAEATARYHRKLIQVNRAELIADIYVSLNQKDLQYLASYYGIEPDGGSNYDYSDIINTLISSFQVLLY